MFRLLVIYKGYSGSAMTELQFDNYTDARYASDKISSKRDMHVIELF